MAAQLPNFAPLGQPEVGPLDQDAIAALPAATVGNAGHLVGMNAAIRRYFLAEVPFRLCGTAAFAANHDRSEEKERRKD